jgi:hypothetical protein
MTGLTSNSGNVVKQSWQLDFYFRPYLLTPCSGVVLEKSTDFQLVKKHPEFYEARKFISLLTSACNLNLLKLNLLKPFIESLEQFNTTK